MKGSSIPARGLVFAALVPLLFTACTPAPDYPPPEPGSLAAAEQALRRGDLPALRDAIGKGKGLCDRARELAAQLDPDSWLIAMGAVNREHDLPAAARAMQAGDDAALADALGYSDQQLHADILGGGASVFARRADGRNYYETGAQPIALMQDVKLPSLPAGGLALSVTLWGIQQERRYRLSYTFNRGGVAELQAVHELGRDAIDAPGPRHADITAALPPGTLRGLKLADLAEPRWYGAEFRLLLGDGSLEYALLGRNEQGWALAESGTSSLAQRLAERRDERLRFLARRASDFERSSGRPPRGFHELSHKPRDLVDPGASAGRLGWADYDAEPQAGFELGDGTLFVVAATEAGPKGRRAVSRDGTLGWIP